MCLILVFPESAGGMRSGREGEESGGGHPASTSCDPVRHPHPAAASWQADAVPQIDLAEETFVAASPARVRSRVATLAFAQGLWPGLNLRVTEDRGAEGLRFGVAGPVSGSAELWLERWADGVIVHVYLRVDPAGGPWSARRVRRERDRLRGGVTPALWGVKDELEAGRCPGEPAKR